MLKREVALNKSICCGIALLEASERFMFNFYHNFMMREFNPSEC